MSWEKPGFVEIGMNAEIGGYQSDFGDSEPAGPRKPVVGPAAPGASAATESSGTRAPRRS